MIVCVLYLKANASGIRDTLNKTILPTIKKSYFIDNVHSAEQNEILCSAMSCLRYQLFCSYIARIIRSIYFERRYIIDFYPSNPGINNGLDKGRYIKERSGGGYPISSSIEVVTIDRDTALSKLKA